MGKGGTNTIVYVIAVTYSNEILGVGNHLQAGANVLIPPPHPRRKFCFARMNTLVYPDQMYEIIKLFFGDYPQPRASMVQTLVQVSVDNGVPCTSVCT